MPGVKAVVELAATSTTAAAVAVVADSWWRAQSALARLEIVWDAGPHAALDTEGQRAAYAKLLAGGKARAYEEVGDAAAALAGAQKVVEAELRGAVPRARHHGADERTALVKDGALRGLGRQPGAHAREVVRREGRRRRPSDAVTVHTPFLGGGFGRRAEVDVVVRGGVDRQRACRARRCSCIWSREEDMQHDVYRPMARSRLRCALDADRQRSPPGTTASSASPARGASPRACCRRPPRT